MNDGVKDEILACKCDGCKTGFPIHYCPECFAKIVESALQKRAVHIDVNEAVAQAMNGQGQECEQEECCQNIYSEVDCDGFPKILPPDDITLTPEQLELLSPHTVVAGRLE